MEFANLPTDNLYIFICFAGIVILALIIRKENRESSQLDQLIDELHEAYLRHNHKTQIIKWEVENVEKKMKAYTEKFNSYLGSNMDVEEFINEEINEDFLSRVSLENLSRFQQERIDFGELIFQKKVKIAELDLENKLNKKVAAKLDMNLKAAKKNVKPAVAQFAIGLILISLGFKFWYTKHQYYQDEILKLQYEELKSKDIGSEISAESITLDSTSIDSLSIETLKVDSLGSEVPNAAKIKNLDSTTVKSLPAENAKPDSKSSESPNPDSQ